MKGKEIITKMKYGMIALVSLFLFASFTVPVAQSDQDSSIKDLSKRETMLGILESLEAGEPYSRDESWSNGSCQDTDHPRIYFRSIDHSDFDHKEFSLDEFEERMIQFEEQLEKKMDQIIRKVGTQHSMHIVIHNLSI